MNTNERGSRKEPRDPDPRPFHPLGLVGLSRDHEPPGPPASDIVGSVGKPPRVEQPLSVSAVVGLLSIEEKRGREGVGGTSASLFKHGGLLSPHQSPCPKPRRQRPRIALHVCLLSSCGGVPS